MSGTLARHDAGGAQPDPFPPRREAESETGLLKSGISIEFVHASTV